MAWTTPYYPWASSDGILNTDLTRIEENTQYLYDENNTTNTYLTDTAPQYMDLIHGLHISIANISYAFDYNRIHISRGHCKSYVSNDIMELVNATGLTKDIAANWTAGSGVGGFPSGLTFANDTDYYVFLIHNPTSGVVDAGFDVNSGAVNLLADATGFTNYQLIGTVRTKSSATEIRFSEDYAGPTSDSTYRDIVKSCYPMASVGFATEIEATFTSVYNLKTHVLEIATSEIDEVSNVSSLYFTTVTSNKPVWTTLGTFRTTSASAIIYNGSSVSGIYPGMADLQAGYLYISTQSSSSNAILSTNFTTSLNKGLDEQTLTYTLQFNEVV